MSYRRIFKTILLAFLLLVVFIFLSRNLLIRAAAAHYLEKEFKGVCSIEALDLWINRLTLEGFKFSNENIKLELEKGVLEFSVFPARARLSGLALEGFDFKMNGLRLKGLSLTPSAPDTYELNISSLRFKESQVKFIAISIKVGESKIIFGPTFNPALGPQGSLAGVIDRRGGPDLCLELSLDKVSAPALMALIAKDQKDIALEGLFAGELVVCLKGGKPVGLRGNFHNQGQGLINIKKETSLDFLKQYLDGASYKVLIDGLKNYKYNEGKITVGREANDLIIDISFDSLEAGKRIIPINFHDVLGGAE
jgi:hypothetical protein